MSTPAWFNYQSAYPNGAIEQKRLLDCEELMNYLIDPERGPFWSTSWHSVREIMKDLQWSRHRARGTIRAMRGVMEHTRIVGEHGAEEDRWRIKDELV